MIHGYARVSTKAQDLTPQVRQLRAAGADQIHSEKTSGASHRPVLDSLMDDVLQPGDTLVICALDRLGRIGSSLIQLVDDLTERGISLRVLNSAIDTSDPVTGRLVLFIFAALAEAERTLIVERTRAGLAAARAAGRHGGRPTIMSQEKLDVARSQIRQGSTIAAAARIIGVSRSTLSRHL